MQGRHSHERGHGHGSGAGRRHQGRAAHLLEPAVLLCLMQGPVHGYALAEQLEAFNLEQIPLRRVYRALQGMEELGWIKSDWETEETHGPPRRVYGLAPEGQAVLADWMVSLRKSRDMIDGLLAAYREHAEGEA
jgi:PadR family transcriptional regulator, regulatory protein PadR